MLLLGIDYSLVLLRETQSIQSSLFPSASPLLGPLGRANLSSEIRDQLRLMGTNKHVSIFTWCWRMTQFPKSHICINRTVRWTMTLRNDTISNCKTICYSHDKPNWNNVISEVRVFSTISLWTRNPMLRRSCLHLQDPSVHYIAQFYTQNYLNVPFVSVQPTFVVDTASLNSAIIYFLAPK
jgi:hypothetical protein